MKQGHALSFYSGVSGMHARLETVQGLRMWRPTLSSRVCREPNHWAAMFSGVLHCCCPKWNLWIGLDLAYLGAGTSHGVHDGMSCQIAQQTRGPTVRLQWQCISHATHMPGGAMCLSHILWPTCTARMHDVKAHHLAQLPGGRQS